MIARIRKSLDEKEKGFTLIELLVVIIIIGIRNWSGALRHPGVSARELNERVEAVDAMLRGGGEVAA